MEINIKSIHFDATEQLQSFIEKKLNKLARRFESITKADVTLKVVKPETSMNKEAAVKLTIPMQEEFYASKIADTFEEAVDLSLKAIERQLQRIKSQKDY